MQWFVNAMEQIAYFSGKLQQNMLVMGDSVHFQSWKHASLHLGGGPRQGHPHQQEGDWGGGDHAVLPDRADRKIFFRDIHKTENVFQVGTDSEGEEDEIFFIWPTTLVHKINSDSPFYNMSAKDFLKKRYEVVVILEGVIEQTGNSIQVIDKNSKVLKQHICLILHIAGAVILPPKRSFVGLSLCEPPHFQAFRIRVQNRLFGIQCCLQSRPITKESKSQRSRKWTSWWRRRGWRGKTVCIFIFSQSYRNAIKTQLSPLKFLSSKLCTRILSKIHSFNLSRGATVHPHLSAPKIRPEKW